MHSHNISCTCTHSVYAHTRTHYTHNVMFGHTHALMIACAHHTMQGAMANMFYHPGKLTTVINTHHNYGMHIKFLCKTL